MKKFLIIFILLIAVLIIGFPNFITETPKTAEGFFDYLKGLPKELSTQEIPITEKILDYSVRVPILVYHSIRPERATDSVFIKSFNTEPQVFEKQMQYLKDNGYVVISLNDLYNALTIEKKLPEKSVVINFDDGWQDQYDNAFPILKKFNYTATFFIFSSAPEHKYFMTWDEIKELDAMGMTIGSHTLNHPYLEKITDLKELEKQIFYGKKSLEKHLGKTADLFAYPFGEYNDQIINVVKSAGFKMARSIHNGRYHTFNDLFTIKAIIMNSDYNRFTRELEKVRVDF